MDDTAHPIAYRPTLRARLENLRFTLRHGPRYLATEIGLRLLRFGTANSGLLAHAKREWQIAFPVADEMQDMVGENIFDMVSVFSAGGHSGGSAGYTINLVEKILRFEPISPLTGNDDEWFEYAEDEGQSFFQNKRDSRVFKNGRDGTPYMIDGKVFREATGGCYTGGNSKVDLPPFPCYAPETVYVDVDEDGNEILDLDQPVPIFQIDEYLIEDAGDTIAIAWECGDGITVDKEITRDEFKLAVGRAIGFFAEVKNDGDDQ